MTIIDRCIYGATADVAAYVAARTGASFDDRIEAIGILDGSGALCGGVVYSDWRQPDIRATIAGDKVKGFLSRKVLMRIFSYPFVQLGCRRITCAVAAANKASARLAEKLGFVREGILRECDANGDDLIIFGLLARDCRWTQ